MGSKFWRLHCLGLIKIISFGEADLKWNYVFILGKRTLQYFLELYLSHINWMTVWSGIIITCVINFLLTIELAVITWQCDLARNFLIFFLVNFYQNSSIIDVNCDASLEKICFPLTGLLVDVWFAYGCFFLIITF